MIEGIDGQHEVRGTNKSGKRLLEMCAEQELVVGNSWSKKRMCISTRGWEWWKEGCRLGKKSKVFYGQEPPSGVSTTTECGFNYELLEVIY